MRTIATDVGQLVTTISPQKWLNRSRCHSGCWLGCAQETMY